MEDLDRTSASEEVTLDAQGGGVFCSPVSATAPAKLRLLYECAPLAFVVEAAGGASQDGHGSSLARRIKSSADRSAISLGSQSDVAKSVPSLLTQTLVR